LAYFILLAPNRFIVYNFFDLCIGGVNISHHKVMYDMRFRVRIILRFRKLHLKKMLVDFRAFEYVESINLKKKKSEDNAMKRNVNFLMSPTTNNQGSPQLNLESSILCTLCLCGKSLLQSWFQIIKCICAPYVCDFGFPKSHWINLLSNKQQYLVHIFGFQVYLILFFHICYF
jgi:hypothetical protein